MEGLFLLDPGMVVHIHVHGLGFMELLVLWRTNMSRLDHPFSPFLNIKRAHEHY